MEEDNYVVKDGTVDFHGNPANRKKTGNWKACAFILGTTFFFRLTQKYNSISLQNSQDDPYLTCCVTSPIFPLSRAGNECCERLAYYGMSTNLVNYFIQRLNQGNATASKNVNNWSGTCYVMPLVGAFLADAYLGRYWVIAIFSIIYVIVSFFIFPSCFVATFL